MNLANTIGTGLPETPDDFKHIKGFAVTGAPSVGATTVTLSTSGFGSRFSPNDDMVIGDGPGINEFFGEWVKVVSVSGNVITFDPPLRRSYENEKACVVPGRLNTLTGRRQHMTDIVVRDLSIAAPTSGTDAGVFGAVRAGVRIRFENVAFIVSPFATAVQNLKEMAFATCGDVTIRDGFFDGDLVLGPVQNATVDNVVAGSLKVTEFSRACNILNAETRDDPGIEVNGGLCTGVTMTNCVVRGDGAIALVYAEQARIENLTASQLTLASGSSGVLATPLAPNPAGVVDGSTAGSWLTPLQRRVSDRKVTSAATGHVTLELLAISGQSVDLQQWQNNSGTVVVSIGNTGTLSVLGSGSTPKLFSISAAGGIDGVELGIASGGAIRLGTNNAGGMITVFTNAATFPGQTYIDCGNNSQSATVFRTGSGATFVERFRITHASDALFSPPINTGIGLVVKGLSSQSGDLQQWQISTGTPKFAIRSDGNLATGNAADVGLGGQVSALPIYNTATGLLIGYIPILSAG